MVQYKLHQTSKRGIAFFSREDDENIINLQKDEYKLVYEGKCVLNSYEDYDDILEDLYTQLNTNHPIDYKARSLSVSDIIEFKDKTYICQSFGWKEITLI